MKRHGKLFTTNDDISTTNDSTTNDQQATAESNLKRLHQDFALLNKDMQLIQKLINDQQINRNFSNNIQNAITAIDQHGAQSTRSPFSAETLKARLIAEYRSGAQGLEEAIVGGLNTFVDKFADGYDYLENKIYGLFYTVPQDSYSPPTNPYLKKVSMEYTNQLIDLRSQIANELESIVSEISETNQILKSSKPTKK